MARAYRYLLIWRIAAVLLALGVAVLLGYLIFWPPYLPLGAQLGRLIAVGPLVAGCLALAATTIAEWTSPITRDAERRASLRPRGIGSIMPRRGSWGFALGVGGFGVALAIATARAAFNPFTTPGRSLAFVGGVCDKIATQGLLRRVDPALDGTLAGDSAGVTYLGLIGPWPGSYYAGPIAVVLGLLVALTFLSLRATAHRPAVDGALATPDEALRRMSARSTLGIAGASVAATAVPTFAFMADSLQRLAKVGAPGCAPSGAALVPAFLCLMLVLVSLAALAVSLLGALAPPAWDETSAADEAEAEPERSGQPV